MAQSKLHPITQELLTVIDGAFAVSRFADTVMINASASIEKQRWLLPKNTSPSQVDTIKIEDDYCVLLNVVVDRQKKLVHILGFMKEVPGTPSLLRFKGEIVLDFNDPKTKVDGNMFVDVFTRMMLQYKAIESLVEEKIVY